MRNLNLKINKEKCIHCGMCIKDCISGALEFDENKTPKFTKCGETICIKCQHCLAICPVGALSIMDKNPENSEFVSKKDISNELLNLMKSRRSIRQFKDENVSEEIMKKLKEMVDFVPSGCNNHGLHVTLIEDKKIMESYKNYVLTKMKNFLKFIPKFLMGRFAWAKDCLFNGDDIIFRGAPHMIVVSAPIDAPCKDIDGTILLSYFELYAQSLGLGTLWCGFGMMPFKVYPKLAEEMNIPKTHKPAYVMLFGNKAVNYSRTIQPEPLEKNIITKMFK